MKKAAAAAADADAEADTEADGAGQWLFDSSFSPPSSWQPGTVPFVGENKRKIGLTSLDTGQALDSGPLRDGLAYSCLAGDTAAQSRHWVGAYG